MHQDTKSARLRWSNTSNKLLQLATQHCCIEKRCWPYYTTHLKHCHATKFVAASWKNLLKKVDANSTWCNMLLQLATTKFCWVTMFEVGGNTCSNAFQVATQQCCFASWRKMWADFRWQSIMVQVQPPSFLVLSIVHIIKIRWHSYPISDLFFAGLYNSNGYSIVVHSLMNSNEPWLKKIIITIFLSAWHRHGCCTACI